MPGLTLTVTSLKLWHQRSDVFVLIAHKMWACLRFIVTETDSSMSVATDEWCLQAPTHVTDSSDAFQATVEDSVSVCESEESHVHSYNETYLQGSEQENYEGVSRRN